MFMFILFHYLSGNFQTSNTFAWFKVKQFTVDYAGTPLLPTPTPGSPDPFSQETSVTCVVEIVRDMYGAAKSKCKLMFFFFLKNESIFLSG